MGKLILDAEINSSAYKEMKKTIGSSSIPPSNLKKGSIAYRNLFSIKFYSMSRCFILQIIIASNY